MIVLLSSSNVAKIRKQRDMPVCGNMCNIRWYPCTKITPQSFSHVTFLFNPIEK